MEPTQEPTAEELRRKISLLEESLARGNASVEAISSEADARAWESGMASAQAELDYCNALLADRKRHSQQ